MRNKKFEIPVDCMSDFAEVLADSELENEICGRSDNDDIIIKVHYEPEDREKVFELMEWIEDNVEEDE